MYLMARGGGKRFKYLLLMAMSMWVTAITMPAFAGQPHIDDNDTTVLRGNTHPLARPEFDAGAVDPALPMERMVLSLRISPLKQAELDRLLLEQHDPASSGSTAGSPRTSSVSSSPRRRMREAP